MICNNGTCTESHLCNDYPYCADNINGDNYCSNNLCGPDKIHCPTGACIDEKKVKECVYISHFCVLKK